MAYAFVKKAALVAGANTISPNNNGDLLIVDIETSAGGGNPTASISDNLSSSWQTAIATEQAFTGQFFTRFYLPNCSTGITTITITFAGGAPGSVNAALVEYSGIATVTPHIVSNTPTGQVAPGTGTDGLTSGNINVTSQPALLFASTIDPIGGSAAVAGTGFTTEGSAGAFFFEDKRLTATGNVAATFTASAGGANTWITAASAFAEPALAASPVIAWVT